MKGYVILVAVIIVVLVSFFFVQNLRIGNVVQEMVIKEVIPRELSEALSIKWEKISIIESKRIKEEWHCYFFTLSSEKSKEFFIAAVFSPSGKIEGQVDHFTEAKSYLLRLTGLKEANIEGCETVYFKGSEIVDLINMHTPYK